ncbi:hemerythrin domain-containing protein [Agromyces kandeliae]|uniref:Hemerythrin domain-containing protein n=1 Tax=Agromyces kandeliae TaxID=2666141 RepID=A0A6L5R3E2_9MICO|nr:hemerythrin domain-containing protein [Agromyces kandeliae]MRX44462.1 hemerythrin domain-containing protein [Agromyces kandeliae]
MAATALPPSGDPPEPGATAARSCDARGMIEIHRMFRAEFAEGPELVRRVAEADGAHADVVGDHLALISGSLHAHHEFEDEHLWDALDERAPACAGHVERMKEQHAEMLVHLRELDAALPAWRASGRATDAAAVLAALDGVNGALAVHLPDEEANIVPVMETVLTQKEVDAAGVHGRRATPKGKTWQQLGAILAAQPDGGDEWLHEHMPAPARLAWRFIGRRDYAANRAALTGDTPARPH